MKLASRKAWGKASRWLIAIASLGYVAYFLLSNREHIEPLFRLRPLILVLLVVAQTVAMLVASIRYHVVLQKCGDRKIPLLAWARLYVLGQFANIMIPQAGNLLRSVRLKRDWGVSYTRYVSSYLSYQWIDTALSIVLGEAVILATQPGFRLGAFRATTVLGGALAAVILLPFAVRAALARVVLRPPWAVWVHEKVSQAVDVSVTSVRDGTYMGKTLSLGVLGFALQVTVIWLGFACLDIRIGLSGIVLISVLLRLGLILQITPGNIGVRELVWGALGEFAHVGMAAGLLAALLFRMISTLLIFALGILCGGVELLRNRPREDTPDSAEPDRNAREGTP